MTKADDALDLIKDEFTLGVDQYGHPWAVEVNPPMGRHALNAAGGDGFPTAVRALWSLKHGTALDARHLSTAVSTAKGIAQRGPEVVSAPDVKVATSGGGLRVDREAPEVARAVTDFLAEHPRVFVSRNQLVAVTTDTTEGRAMLWPMDKAAPLRSLLHQEVRTYVVDRSGAEVETFCPIEVAGVVAGMPEWPGVRVLDGISRLPLLRPDGTMATANGYDPETRLWLDVDDDLRDLEVPECPTPEEVASAVGVLLGVYSGFPFVGDADRANAIGLGLTAYVRQVVRDLLVPVHVVTAPAQSSGKSILGMTLPGTLAGGHMDAPMSTSPEEQRKSITSVLRSTSAPLLCWDNLEEGSEVESPVLAQLLTTHVWDDRVLGGSEYGRFPNDRIWTVTGNRLTVGPDLRPRAVLVDMDAGMERPEVRTFSQRLDDDEVLRGLRRELVTAAFTVTRAWVLAGMPSRTDGEPMRQFTRWAQAVGGLLEFIGVEGHLGNRSAMDDLDESSAIMAGWLRWLHGHFGGEPFTAHEVVGAISGDEESEEVHPANVAEKIEREPERDTAGRHVFPTGEAPVSARKRSALVRSIGNTLRHSARRYYAGVRVVMDGHDRTRRAIWRLEVLEGAEDVPGLGPPFCDEEEGEWPPF